MTGTERAVLSRYAHISHKAARSGFAAFPGLTMIRIASREQGLWFIAVIGYFDGTDLSGLDPVRTT